VLPDIHRHANMLTHLHRGRTPLNAPTTTVTLSPTRHTTYRMQDNYFINPRIKCLAFVSVTYLSLQWLYEVTSFSGFYTPDKLILLLSRNLNILSQLANSSLCTHIQWFRLPRV